MIVNSVWKITIVNTTILDRIVLVRIINLTNKTNKYINNEFFL